MKPRPRLNMPVNLIRRGSHRPTKRPTKRPARGLGIFNLALGKRVQVGGGARRVQVGGRCQWQSSMKGCGLKLMTDMRLNRLESDLFQSSGSKRKRARTSGNVWMSAPTLARFGLRIVRSTNPTRRSGACMGE